jgi:hypothetical protein
MERYVSYTGCPALGDIRRMGSGDTIALTDAAKERKDWGRIVDALAAAVSRGAGVRWL